MSYLAGTRRTSEVGAPTFPSSVHLHLPGGRLSVTLITLNEEANLPRCLASIKGLADEILVLDSGSTDRTLSIALEAGARIFTHPFSGYGEQKQRALELAEGDWVLWLDADEWLDEEAQSAISQLLNSPPPADIGGFQMRRLDAYLGRWIRHGGWSSRWKVRLVRRGCARWSRDPIHESLHIATGRTARLPGRVRHQPYRDIGHHIAKLNQYTEIIAAGDRDTPLWRIWIGLLIEPPWVFIQRYLLQLGCLDGVRGFILAVLDACYFFLRYAKIRQHKEHLSAVGWDDAEHPGAEQGPNPRAAGNEGSPPQRYR